MAASITIVGIDAFDSAGVFQDPPRPFLQQPPSPNRQVLLYNYAGPQLRRRDVRPRDADPRARQRYIYFSHFQHELYHQLILGPAPVFDEPFDGTGLANASVGYLKNRQEAMKRYNLWELELQTNPGEAPQKPLEVIYCRQGVPLQAPILALRNNPNDPTDKRYRINVTPPGGVPHLYRGPASVLSKKYAYLPPGTPGNPVPFMYQGQGLPFTTLMSHNHNHPRQLYALGCTCLDYAFRGYGGLDASAQGCKHMIFWNLCRKRENASGISKIVWPHGVP